jgi:hypothetical protein
MKSKSFNFNVSKIQILIKFKLVQLSETKNYFWFMDCQIHGYVADKYG